MFTLKKFENNLNRLTDAIARFPLTTLFLLATAIVNAISINTEKDDFSKYLYTFVVGTFLSAGLQVAYERFFTKLSTRVLLMGAGIVLTAGYYVIIMNSPTLGLEMMIRTLVTNFALLIAFIWVPVIKSNISFNQSFMITFKSIFTSLFFSGVLFIGINIIIFAIDQLIFSVNYKVYPHTANIVFVLFATMYFLSLIPVFPGTMNRNKNSEQLDVQHDRIVKASHCPKFVEVLISYIIIPLIAVFTLILLLYIFRNIGGKFWTDNLLEPMLVSYAITVILVYILASEINNSFTLWFRKVFPKILVPIVIFQIVASVLSLAVTGLTYGRYYVILFGVFAAISGILLSFLPVRKNGLVAMLLIFFSVISIVPPVDAFTMSRTSQTETLKKVLVKNHMFENNQIQANASISDQDKEIITNTVSYLSMMEYTKRIEWLPDDFNMYEDFSNTFGFDMYDSQPGAMENQSVYVSLDNQSPMTFDISQYNAFVKYTLDLQNMSIDNKIADIEKLGKHYSLVHKATDGKLDIKLMEDNHKELISFNTQEVFDHFKNRNTRKEVISVKEATFSKENEHAKMTVVVQNLNIEKVNNPPSYYAELYIFVEIK